MKKILASIILGMGLLLPANVSAVPLKPGTHICINNPEKKCENPELDYGQNSFACINNPNPVCGNPKLDYGQPKKGNFACINNPNPVCENPQGYTRDN